MITKFYQYKTLNENNDPHSFFNMIKEPSRLFFMDVKDQMLGYVDKIISESEYKLLTAPNSYWMVFEYKGKKFKMQFSSSAMSVRCEYVNGDNLIDIGSMSQSVSILFKKIDKFLKKHAAI